MYCEIVRHNITLFFSKEVATIKDLHKNSAAPGTGKWVVREVGRVVGHGEQVISGQQLSQGSATGQVSYTTVGKFHKKMWCSNRCYVVFFIPLHMGGVDHSMFRSFHK